MRRRFAMMTVGVTAGLLALALAPVASANEGHDEPAEGGTTCTYEAGDASAVSDISGESQENSVSQAPVAGDNRDNVCGMLVAQDDDGRTVLVDATDLAP